jgi:hypothetical protein
MNNEGAARLRTALKNLLLREGAAAADGADQHEG